VRAWLGTAQQEEAQREVPLPTPCPARRAAIESFFGYQEGTRRNVTCMDGGYFRGMELTFSREGGYKEEFLSGLRLLCTRWAPRAGERHYAAAPQPNPTHTHPLTRGPPPPPWRSFHIDVEFWGPRNDSFAFGSKGKSENPMDLASGSQHQAVCPDGSGINWLTWREAEFHPGQAGEVRIGGFTLRCSDGATRVVDPGHPNSPAYPHSDGCKAGEQKLAAVEMWFSSDNFNGFTPVACA
jgi:hypothetical protein